MSIKKSLVIIGGLFQLLATVVHTHLFFKFAAKAAPIGVPPLFYHEYLWSVYLFNAMVTVTLLFFTCVSLIKPGELLQTRLGRAILWLIAGFYAAAKTVELLRNGWSELGGILFPVIGLYIYLALAGRTKTVNPDTSRPE